MEKARKAGIICRSDITSNAFSSLRMHMKGEFIDYCSICVYECELNTNPRPPLVKKDDSVELSMITSSLNYLESKDWNNKGVKFDNSGNKRKAMECYEKAVELDPDNYIAWCNLGIHYDELKDREKAINCYKKVLKINPEDIIAKKRLNEAMKISKPNDRTKKEIKLQTEIAERKVKKTKSGPKGQHNKKYKISELEINNQIKKSKNLCNAEGCYKIEQLPFTCKRCGKKFCGEHRLPESHNCRKFNI